MSLIEKRYAEALIGISEKESAIESHKQQLYSVSDLFANQSDFRYFLLNPQIKVDTKKDAITKIFGGNIHEHLINFLMLLLDKGRIKLLPGIYKEYADLADKKGNVLNMTIISAASLDEAQINEIKEKYAKVYNASTVKADIEVDKGLIGGVKVKIGDKVIDGTVKGKLEGLRTLLTK